MDDFLFVCRDRLVYLDLLHFLHLQQFQQLSPSSITGNFSQTILQSSPPSNPHIARWCGFLIQATSIQLDSSRYRFHHHRDNNHKHNQSRFHLHSHTNYDRHEFNSIHSILGIVQTSLKPRLAVLRSLISFPAIVEDLYLCVREALQRVQKEGKWIVRKESKMRLVLRRIIHYLKHHIPGVEECKIRWTVYFAFIVLWRRNHHFRKVRETIELSLL